jgi:hypothetical protein
LPVFHPLPALTSSDVADLLDAICVRMLALLEREGLIEDRGSGRGGGAIRTNAKYREKPG